MRKPRLYQSFIAVAFASTLVLLISVVNVSLQPNLPAHGRTILRNATEVEVFRPEGRATGNSSSASTSATVDVALHTMVKTETRLQSDFKERLAALLMDRRGSEYFNPPTLQKGCYFAPAATVGFRFREDNELLDAVLCFRCGYMELTSGDGRLINGKVTQRYFSNLRPQFVQLAKEAFPNDKEIQVLKEQQ